MIYSLGLSREALFQIKGGCWDQTAPSQRNGRVQGNIANWREWGETKKRCRHKKTQTWKGWIVVLIIVIYFSYLKLLEYKRNDGGKWITEEAQSWNESSRWLIWSQISCQGNLLILLFDL